MIEKDSKKIEYTAVRSEIVKEITIIKNLKLISKEKKEELINDLLAQKAKTESRNNDRYKKLLNKPMMTSRDKDTMKKTIQFLIDHNMHTSENLWKLEQIYYHWDFIQIGWVKRTRENLKAEPNEKNIFKDEDTDDIYFKFDALKKQNKLLAKTGMKIPWKNDFIESLQALPWDFQENDNYLWGNILWILLDLPMSGCLPSPYIDTIYKDESYIRFFSESSDKDVWYFNFNENGCTIYHDEREMYRTACLVRPIHKY